ncbi:MAG TPA: hypothetical protein VJ907_09775 [Halanaerobiales bacterium]|nr:hypothetical protein [Halanaerobiales bacterium]
MRLVFITPVVKQRVKEMIYSLMPDVGYIKISNSGVVTMKKNWYSLQKITSTVTDLLMGTIPQKIAQHVADSSGGYIRLFNQDLTHIMSMRTYDVTFDICDYVWDQYNKNCIDLTTIVYNTQKEVMYLEKHDYLPSIKPFSNSKVKDLVRAIGIKEKKIYEERFKKSLNRMKNHLPVPLNPLRFFGSSTIIMTT